MRISERWRGLIMLRGVAILVFISFVACTGFAAEDSPFNVDFSCGWSGYYRPLEWTPLEIGISSTLAEPFGGSVIVSAAQDELNIMNIVHNFSLTPDMPLHLPLVTKLAFAADKCTVRIVDEKGREQWRYSYDLWNYSNRNKALTTVTDKDLLIGLIGSRKFGLISLPKHSVCVAGRNRGSVFIGQKLSRMVPWDWTGFACLDILILYNPDWSAFNRYQYKAIVQWIEKGGAALIVLGNRSLPVESTLAKELPFEIGRARKINLESSALSNLQLLPDATESVICRPITAKPSAWMCRKKVMNGEDCLFATAKVGFGRVGILGFDPAELTEKQRQNSSVFWVGLIEAILGKNEETQSIVRRSSRSSVLTRKCSLAGDLVHPGSLPGGIELKIEGLEPGKYKLTSCHNNPYGRYSEIDIYVNGKAVKRNLFQTSVRSDKDAPSFVTPFTLEDTNVVVIEFRPVPSSPLDRRAALAAFSLEKYGQNGNSGGGSKEKVLAVDFGAIGQKVADGYVGLGLDARLRRSPVSFNSSDGLPDGITLTLKATNPDDKLQFRGTCPPERWQPAISMQPEQNFYLGRSIAYTVNTREVFSFSDYYEIGLSEVGTNAVIEYLYDIPQMEPLSIWWVVGLLMTLAILLGPVDYFVLKRINRLPMTWLTCAAWTAVFTIGAYYGVEALRGGNMQLRAATVTDAVGDGKNCWSTMYLGIFAPRSDDYRLKGPEQWWKEQWWSAVAPTAQIITPQPIGAKRNLYCLQQDGYNRPYSIPINIWTMQCLIEESPCRDFPIQAAVKCEGNQVALTITNNSDNRIKSGFVLIGKDRWMKFGGVPPHLSKEFKGALTNSESLLSDDFWYSSLEGFRHRLESNLRNEAIFFAKGCIKRTLAILQYLNEGAALVCAEYENPKFVYAIEGRTGNYNHVHIVRQIVFPEKPMATNGEATEMSFENGQNWK